jgi:predicted kinase
MFLYVLCGLPGIGKSYWANKYLDYPDVKIVSTDDIRHDLFNDVYSKESNAAVFDAAYAMIDNGLEDGRPVCFDATNITPGYRARVIEIGKKHRAYVIGVSFTNDPKLANDRNANRERVVPAEVIDRMSKQFVPPSKDEGFDYIWSINPDGSTARGKEDIVK